MLGLNSDGYLLFLARSMRMFSYGFLSIGLLLYLDALSYSQFEIGTLFTATLLGDLFVTLYLTTVADSFGRKATLMIGAVLKIFAGVVFASSDRFVVLLLAGVIGVISPTGGEIGPFLAVEQAALTETVVQPEKITMLLGWYNVFGYLSQALGSLVAGVLIFQLQANDFSQLDSYRSILIGYALFGAVKLLLYSCLSPSIEALHTRDLAARGSFWDRFGLHRPESRKIVAKLSCLFVLDAFGGGFVMQTILVYWFAVKYPSMDAEMLGTMLAVANILAGLSALAATPLVQRIGAINVMVVTHFPSNILLLFVPFMPTRDSAVLVLLLRFTVSQMDVPARQSYIATVVHSDERSAAGGITNLVRSIGLSVSPLLAGYLLEQTDNAWLFSMPFIFAGGLKCLYDLLLFFSFNPTERSWSAHSDSEKHTAKTAVYGRLAQNDSVRGV